MCGIVGAIGSDINLDTKKIFRDLLVIDTIRGADSTGFVGVDRTDVVMYKKAVDGSTFISLPPFNKQMTSLINPVALIGHNRWATKGKITDYNAHPFDDGTTYLVHNGSLTGNSWEYGARKLHRQNETCVDSEAICFNVEHEGLKATVEKLDGSFAIVTYSSLLDTVSFVRNDERPLYFAHVKDKDILLYASEKYMIELAAKRHLVDLNEEPWLLTSGKILSFDLSHKTNILGTRDLDEDVNLYEPPSYSSGYSWRRGQGYTGGHHVNNQVVTVKKKNTPASNVIDMINTSKSRKKNLTNFGLVVQQELMFVPSTFKQYTNGKGCITGDLYGGMDGCPDLIGEAIMYKLDKNQFKEIENKVVKVKAESVTYPHGSTQQQAYPCVNFFAAISEKQQETFWKTYSDYQYSLMLSQEQEDGDDFDIADFLGADGNYITALSFRDLVKHGCGVCNEAIEITPEESKSITWVFNNQPLCSSCTDFYDKKEKKTGETVEELILGGGV